MKNFIFKSTDADLQKMFSILFNIQSNNLYITHRIDYLVKKISALETDKGLQRQVDKYYGNRSDSKSDSEDSQIN